MKTQGRKAMVTGEIKHFLQIFYCIALSLAAILCGLQNTPENGFVFVSNLCHFLFVR